MQQFNSALQQTPVVSTPAVASLAATPAPVATISTVSKPRSATVVSKPALTPVTVSQVRTVRRTGRHKNFFCRGRAPFL
ncbi:MAG: hypothetical protein WC916_05295 [Candidatus Woesearchaeota archaeon]